MSTFTTISPVTNSGIYTRPNQPTGCVADLLSRSATTQADFAASTSLSDRKRIVAAGLDGLLARADELALTIARSIGRPIRFCRSEIETAVKRGRYLVSIADRVLSDTPGTEEDGMRRYIRKMPVGVVLIIFPWNYPFLTLVNSLVPAILAGNSVVLKPSPQSPTTAEEVKEIFTSAGLPDGVIDYFHSTEPDVIKSAVQDPHVGHVCFTGSVSAGLAIQRAAATISDTENSAGSSPSLRIGPSVGLELGGNDPAYIRSDVGSSPTSLAAVAAQIVDGAIFNSGQSCCSIERVYVHKSIHDAFVREVVKNVIDTTVLGDPLDPATTLGTVVSTAAATRIRNVVADAIAKGAVNELATEVGRNESFVAVAEGVAASTAGAENYIVPVVLTNVNAKMEVLSTETFGPVIPIVAVDDDDEAVRLMNDSDLGLTASIWTTDEAAGEALADRIEAGTVFVNRADYPSPDLAWTGWKNSGRGHTLSVFGFDQFVRLKSFHVKHFAGV